MFCHVVRVKRLPEKGTVNTANLTQVDVLYLVDLVKCAPPNKGVSGPHVILHHRPQVSRQEPR